MSELKTGLFRESDGEKNGAMRRFIRRAIGKSSLVGRRAEQTVFSENEIGSILAKYPGRLERNIEERRDRREPVVVLFSGPLGPDFEDLAAILSLDSLSPDRAILNAAIDVQRREWRKRWNIPVRDGERP